MPLWNPDKRYEGQDVYIIGGGTSLSGFDFERLRGKNTIGTNYAYKLGKDICNCVFFSDYNPAKAHDFFTTHYDGLAAHGGLILTHNSALKCRPESWLNWYPRKLSGLYRDAIGYNWSSGASAINMALILGASRIFLLGIDCNAPDGKSVDWYVDNDLKERQQVFSQFTEGFCHIKRTLNIVFHDAEIINLNPESALDIFPKALPEDYL